MNDLFEYSLRYNVNPESHGGEMTSGFMITANKYQNEYKSEKKEQILHKYLTNQISLIFLNKTIERNTLISTQILYDGINHN